MALLRSSRVPTFIKWIYPKWFIWDKRTRTKTIYLTFDDGPILEITEFVLDTLSRKSTSSAALSQQLQKPIPATFFCIGDNVRKYPHIFKRILNEGHAIGNHTFHHLKGTVTPQDTYLKNIHLAQLEMAKHLNKGLTEHSTTLFRPPYGKIKRAQARALKKLGYQLIMYRVIAYDWDKEVSPEKCLRHVVSTAKDGDIIVLHDSVKAYKNLQFALPRIITHFEALGFEFGRL